MFSRHKQFTSFLPQTGTRPPEDWQTAHRLTPIAAPDPLLARQRCERSGSSTNIEGILYGYGLCAGVFPPILYGYHRNLERKIDGKD